MHQYTHQHAFTPYLHQPSAGFAAPAMTGTRGSNFIQPLPRGTARLPSFTPATAFHRAAQKSFKSKKMQPEPNSLHQKLTIGLSDSVQHKEPDQRSCIQLYQHSTCGQSAYGKTSETENMSHFKTSRPSDLYTSSAASCHIRTTKREKLGQLLNRNWKKKMYEEEEEEEEEHRQQQLDACLKVLPLKEKSWDHTVVPPEPDRRRDTVSHDRKRPLECGSFINVKRVKQEVVDDQFDSSVFSTDPSSHTMNTLQHINMSNTSILYCNCGCNVARTPRGVVSYPEMYPEMHLYQTASWEQMWNVLKRMDPSLGQQLFRDYLLNSSKVIKMPHAAQSFSTAHLHFPLAMRHHEAAYFSRRKWSSTLS
ncbi:hypothetical protein PAMP_018477 [Pampus punctatissimus]